MYFQSENVSIKDLFKRGTFITSDDKQKCVGKINFEFLLLN